MTSNEIWVVFIHDGQRIALPAVSVERAVTAPALVRLPGSVGMRQGRALQVGNELLPLIGEDPVPLLVLALRHSAGRFAMSADKVLGVGPLASGDLWDGQPVTCRAIDDVVPASRQRMFAPISASARPRPTMAASMAPPAPRWLLLQTGGSAWMLAEAELELIHGPAPCTRVPFSPPALTGVVVLRGFPVPVANPILHARPGGGQAGYAVLRGQTGLVAVPLDTDPAWCERAGAAPRLHPDALREAAGLPKAVDPRQSSAPRLHSLRLLPVLVAGRTFAVPVEEVARVQPAATLVRLPARRSAPDRAVAVDGRLVPVWDARSWLHLGSPGNAAVHVLLREQGVLAVDGVDRTVALEAGQVHAIRDPSNRLAAIAHVPGGTWPVLKVADLGTAP